MPKFELKYEIKLKNVLTSMGMRSVFDWDANLSGIADADPLFVSEVKHKSFLKIDEVGTEAAAVTYISFFHPISFSGHEQYYPTMFINRPFIFVIREKNSDAVLFMGKVKNPSLEN